MFEYIMCVLFGYALCLLLQFICTSHIRSVVNSLALVNENVTSYNASILIDNDGNVTWFDNEHLPTDRNLG